MTHPEELDQHEDQKFDELPDGNDSTGVAVGRLNGLSDPAANGIAAMHRPTVVVLAGNVRTGKTTLLAALYERFSHGPIAGWQFAGSVTLPAFEARAQGMRPVDGAAGPMPHTRLGALPWLHLSAESPTSKMGHLLFGDFDGELFRRLIDNEERVEDTPALRRADHLSLVLDADGLCDLKRRHATKRDVRELIAKFSEGRAGIDSSVYSVVVTKTDVFREVPSERAEWAHAAITELYEEAREAFDAASLELVNTAAVSTDPELPVGHGLESLLDLWWRKPAARPWLEARPPARQAPAADWFARFKS